MEQFNLEEYLKNPSRKVISRNGIPVKIHCTNYFSVFPVIAEIEGSPYSESYNKDGKCCNGGDSDDGLFSRLKSRRGGND